MMSGNKETIRKQFIDYLKFRKYNFDKAHNINNYDAARVIQQEERCIFERPKEFIPCMVLYDGEVRVDIYDRNNNCGTAYKDHYLGVYMAYQPSINGIERRLKMISPESILNEETPTNDIILCPNCHVDFNTQGMERTLELWIKPDGDWRSDNRVIIEKSSQTGILWVPFEGIYTPGL